MKMETSKHSKFAAQNQSLQTLLQDSMKNATNGLTKKNGTS